MRFMRKVYAKITRKLMSKFLLYLIVLLVILNNNSFASNVHGKVDFYIKKNDPALMADIKKAIRIGYEACVEKKWI